MLRVGLTGGIATGKTQVARRLAAAGLQTLDLDAVARETMRPGGATFGPVAESFGPEVLGPDRAIDRAALAQRVFADPEARARLDAIVRPVVRGEEARWATSHATSQHAVCVTEAALLVEGGAHLRFDRLVVVHCSAEAQAARLAAREGLDSEAAWARIRSQMPGDERRRFAHFEIDTSGGLAETDHDADRLAEQLRRLAEEPPTRLRMAPDRQAALVAAGPERGPRGLSPSRLLHALARCREPDMHGLARLLEPPHHGAWYLAARASEPAPGPELLAAPVVLWASARRGVDPPFVLGAMATVARLTHARPGAVADACFLAAALLETAATGGRPKKLRAGLGPWQETAGRWAGTAPSERLVGAVATALAGDENRLGSDDRERVGALLGALRRRAVSIPAQVLQDISALGVD